MVNQFRQVVSAYINQNSEEKNWEEIRELFTVYSYVAFLLVAIKNTTGKVDRVKERAISLGLESKDNLNLLFSYPATENIAEEIARIIDDETQIDINAVYQAYLSVDYRMCNNLVFPEKELFRCFRSVCISLLHRYHRAQSGILPHY